MTIDEIAAFALGDEQRPKPALAAKTEPPAVLTAGTRNRAAHRGRLTNRQIAGKVFLSGRTIEAHVASLGRGSRVQLSRWVAGATEPEWTRTKHSIAGTISLSQPVGHGHVAHRSARSG